MDSFEQVLSKLTQNRQRLETQLAELQWRQRRLLHLWMFYSLSVYGMLLVLSWLLLVHWSQSLRQVEDWRRWILGLLMGWPFLYARYFWFIGFYFDFYAGLFVLFKECYPLISISLTPCIAFVQSLVFWDLCSFMPCFTFFTMSSID